MVNTYCNVPIDGQAVENELNPSVLELVRSEKEQGGEKSVSGYSARHFWYHALDKHPWKDDSASQLLEFSTLLFDSVDLSNYSLRCVRGD